MTDLLLLVMAINGLLAVALIGVFGGVLVKRLGERRRLMQWRKVASA